MGHGHTGHNYIGHNYIGHNYAGKTTLSRLIFRFYDVHSGAVRFNGADIAQHTQRSVRGLVGIVPQDTVLFNDTILHNVRYGDTSATLEEVEAACRKAQILDFILGLPDGWETRVGERHNYIGHNYMGHNCIGHNYMGHNCTCHNCISHNCISHNCIGHNCMGHNCIGHN